MTDFAAVTGHAGAAPATGAAKGQGVKAAGANVLDGAFAAILGKAAGAKGLPGATDGEAAAALAAQAGKPVVADPALAQGDAAVPLGAIAMPAGEAAGGEPGEIDPATGKSRKPVARGKTAETDAQLAQAQAIAANAAPAVAQEAASVAKKSDGEGIKAVKGDAANAAQPERVAQAAEDKAGKDEARPVVAEAAKPAPTSGTVTAKDQQPQQPVTAQADANAAGQQADSAPDGRAGKDEGRERGHGKPASAAIAANDDSVLVGADPLRDIMQSLPPVLQSQLHAAALDAPAARTASTGELLGNQAIDMSVSGQWIDRMAREIATLADGTGHSQFQLSPPNLGKIQVDLWQGDDRMNLRILTESDEAARRLREGQGALEAHARVASLSLGSVSVEKASAPLDSGDRQPNQRQADQGGTPNQQQAFAQAQGQSAQGRENSNGNLNRGGAAAVIGSEGQAEPEQDVRAGRSSDPRVRFA